MRRIKFFSLVWLLEFYALALVFLQTPGGVRTDEAKYLLSIPYPHPPLIRSLMAWTASMPAHEFFWRFIIASIVVQVVWIIVDLGDVLTKPRQYALAAVWLFSAAVLLQSGTIVMAVFAGVFGMIFVWFALHPKSPTSPALISLLWLASLFTVYQSVLYAPLVLYALVRTRTKIQLLLTFFLVPILLLLLYSFTNPLALASMANVSVQDAPIPALERYLRVGWIWFIAGSGIVSIAGTIGILTSSRWDLVSAFGLVFGFIILSSQAYYALLLTPIFIGGTFLLFCRRRLHPALFVFSEIVCTAIIVSYSLPVFHTTHARTVMRLLHAQNIAGPVLIDGPFGHEWQYEAEVPVLRFSQKLAIANEEKAQAFVCTKRACDDDVNLDRWVRLPDAPVPVWLRR